MKVIIAGGRDYVPNDATWAALDHLHAGLGITEVVSGRARGADAAGEQWAEKRGIPVKPFPPDIKRHGSPAAFHIRNQQMADYADRLIVFPGGNGTADMIRRAKAAGLGIDAISP